ncbi:MAG TPA: hypothetical protein VHR45_19700 [Thermoanaerobaculia bacterium]|nr:hypothetical protein [Thermoanaerobaculia bacterium]
MAVAHASQDVATAARLLAARPALGRLIESGEAGERSALAAQLERFRLRQKIEIKASRPRFLVTVGGAGYTLLADGEPQSRT